MNFWQWRQEVDPTLQFKQVRPSVIYLYDQGAYFRVLIRSDSDTEATFSLADHEGIGFGPL